MFNDVVHISVRSLTFERTGLVNVGVMWQLGLRGVRWGNSGCWHAIVHAELQYPAGTVHVECCGSG
jgi:hypothetical protein